MLSSRIHGAWALAAGSWLGVGNDPVYVKSRCFEAFPFPVTTPTQQACIRDLAEEIDAQRKRVLAEHEALTLTGLYNVIEKLKAGGALNAKEKSIHDLGLVAVLKSLHEELDAAVLAAYGWHDHPDDEQILERLVALNAERAAEEAAGTFRWLRPGFQAPSSAQVPMAGLGDSGRRNQKSDGATSPPVAPARMPQQWPGALPDQLAALAAALGGTPQSLDELAARFTGRGRWKARLPDILAALEALGRARRLDDGRWLA